MSASSWLTVIFQSLWVLSVEIKGLGFYNTWEHGNLTLVLIVHLKVKDKTDDVKK